MTKDAPIAPSFIDNHLIEGISPLAISAVRVKYGRRWGPHPSWTKVMSARHPIRGAIGAYDSSIFDGWYPACVRIYGRDGDCLKTIAVRSNARADQLKQEIEAKLNRFLERLQYKQENEL